MVKFLLVGASLDGVNFDDAFAHAKTVKVEDITVHVLPVEDMIINKRAAGRTKDMADLDFLHLALLPPVF